MWAPSSQVSEICAKPKVWITRGSEEREWWRGTPAPRPARMGGGNSGCGSAAAPGAAMPGGGAGGGFGTAAPPGAGAEVIDPARGWGQRFLTKNT